jgi:hypothetical protein
MWSDLFELSRSVGGPVHVHVAAAAAGVTPATIRSRARREGWWQPYRDVVAPPGTEVTGAAWARAAQARVRGPDPDAPRPVAIGGWTAAAAHGVATSWPTRVHVVVPVARAPRGGDRLEVVRCRSFATLATEQRDHLWVLSPAPLLVRSLAPITSVEALRELTIDLVQQRRTTLEAITEEHRRGGPYPAARRVAQVLAELDAAGRTDSSLEYRIRTWLTEAGVPLDPGQIEVRCRDGVAIHFDLGIAAILLAIEVTSMRAHSHRTQLRTDARRDNEVARLDDAWRVLRATWEDLHDPGFLATVREVVAEQSRRVLCLPWPPATAG